MNAVKKFVEYFGDYGREEMKLGNGGNTVCSCIFAGIVEFAMFFPIRGSIWDGFSTYFIMMEIFAIIAVIFQIEHHLVQSEEGKTFTIYRKLAYVPVEKCAIQKELCRKLLKYVGITTIIAVFLQGVMTLLRCPQYIGENFLCAVVMMGVIPFGAGMLLIYIRK